MNPSQPPASPGEPSGEMPPELQELAVDFDLEGEVGRGGTAVVYRARERALNRVVAIKVIRARYVDDEELVARLEREARLVARLDHPNVVTLLGVRRLAHGSLALVMRYVHGHTLRDELERRGALPLPRVRSVLEDVGRALSAAHAHGIVHRDVKPENIHIEHGAHRALLGDFGSATPLRDDLRLTVAGVSIGTPGYMAPELIDGGAASPSADVYGLGLVAWEMLAGRAPWEGESLFAILSFRKSGQLPALRSIRSDIPEVISDAVAGALATDPAERWPDVASFMDALSRPVPRRWLGGATHRRATPTLNRENGPGAGAPPDAARLETVRIARATIPLLTPTTSPADAPPPPPPAASVDPEPHPSVAIFAADDADDDYWDQDIDPARPGRRRRIGILAIAALLLVVGGAALFRMSLDTTPEAHVIAAASDAPLSRSVPTLADSVLQPDAEAGSTTAGMDGALQSTVDSTPPPATLSGGTIVRAGDVAPTVDRSAPTGNRRPLSGASSSPVATPRTNSTTTPPTSAAAIAPPADATPTPTPSPSPNSGSGGTVTQVALGGLHSCAILADGQLDCWGADDNGQLRSPRGGSRFVSVAAGLTHSCARDSSNRTFCWGNNDRGELGDGTTVARTQPVAVRGGSEQVALALGEGFTCALTTRGLAECWGANDVGQLGTGDLGPHSTPTRVAGDIRYTLLVSGWRHACALDSDGGAFCWGDNAAGQLGDGTTTSRDTPTPVNSSLRFRDLAAGRTHSCGVTSDGGVYCWGRNDAGQLGIGSRTSVTTPRKAELAVPVREIVAGSMHSCALGTNGAVYCWGQNRYGQLGDGTSIDRDTPVRVTGLPAISELDASGAHSCGRTSQGKLYCWGYNLYGQLGDGSRQNRTSPAPVIVTP